jgi:hypothetical protein
MSMQTDSETRTSVKSLSPMRNVQTAGSAVILDELGISVLVTTSQAGKLVMLRSEQGTLNTHFRSFARPMGLVRDGDRLAVGTALRAAAMSSRRDGFPCP